ncbi:MAG: FtsX-like permease family protein [Methylocystis sp.]|nr:FtsX-like permease family protein [Methylocystis sp.]MCA3584948.1 FtsX-like permease family protein [Methylocystis sp.]MCA3589850.1 FtsX-like permease family protein [Methylocystis sp.]MCA3593487.1 FtsX-like permease family protein [Methylocystis sp.]
MSGFVAQKASLGLILRFALRDLRGGIRGFGIFIACIAIGVAAITAVAAVSRGLTDSLAREGRVILGADVAFVTLQREATAGEALWLKAQGVVTPVAYLRAMVRADNGDSALVEGKSVDGRWPMHGQAVTNPAAPIAELLAEKDGIFGAIADPLLLARLNLKTGDSVTIGDKRFQLRAELLSEPDKLAGGVGFGPRLLLSEAGLRASGLLQPGSLVRWSYRITLPDGTDEARVQAVLADAKSRFPEAGWNVRSRMNAAPQFSRQIDRFTQFLTLIGLTALMVGGVGVANATQGFVQRKRPDLATLKSLGATGGFVFALTLAEVMLLALAGSLIGLAAGTAAPYLLLSAFGHLLPVPITLGFQAWELLRGLAYGLLTALAFSVWPLGQAHDIPVSALFRDSFDKGGRRPRLRYVIMTAAAIAALVILAVVFSWDRRIAMLYVASAAGAFFLLRLVGEGVMAAARRLPRPRSAEARLALANIHRPGALTPSVTLSLGLGLTLLVALGLIDTNLRRALTASLPERAPSFFFLDIPNAETGRFDAFLKTAGTAAEGAADGDVTIDRVPMMRGRIVAIKGIPAESYTATENASWVLEGDRGITYSANIPTNSRVISGEWWPADYRGPPLVSMTRDIAEGLALAVGDEITVNVLGRNITVRLASIRQVDWRSVGINFVMVFSPNTFAGAPHTHLATLSFGKPPGQEAESRLAREVAQAFPAVSSVRVRDVLEAAGALVRQLTTAMRGASAVALISSILVLAGALASGRAARTKDAVIMKTLGATRRQLFLAYLMEYGLLGLVAAAFGLVTGIAAAYGIVTGVMRLPFAIDWTVAAMSITISLLVTVILGLLGTWRILGQKPAPYLREL